MAEHTHEGHRERLRRRMRENGLGSFAPHEALELILTFAIPQRDVNPLAHQLIDRFGSFSQVLDASVEELQRVPGIGERTAVFLSMIGQSAGYYQRDKFAEKPLMLDADMLGSYCRSLFINDNEENLYLISVNIQGRLLNSTLITTGSLDEIVIYTRNVINAALRANAYAVVLTHNHPGGSLYPSGADVATTRDIASALAAIDVPLIDHIIVASGQYVSMAADGYLDDYRRAHPNPMADSYMRQFFDQ